MYGYYLSQEENKEVKNYGAQLETIYNQQTKKLEKILSICELCPQYGQKSFYGKAKIIETETGRYLLSYETIICSLSYGGTFIKYWDGYSVTTMKHIQAFFAFVRWPSGGKSWWTGLEAGKEYDYSNIVS